MKIQFTILLAMILWSNLLLGQAVECQDAEPMSIEDLHQFSFTMDPEFSPGNQPWPVCPSGGAPHNIFWIAFVADDGDYTIQISPANCMGSITGDEGLQFGVYTDCSFTESIYCEPQCSTDTIVIGSELLISDETYYLFIDGCSGSYCEILLEVFDGKGNPLSTLDGAQDFAPIVVYPNPVQGMLIVESSAPFDGVSLFTAALEKVNQIPNRLSKERVEFDTSELLPGTYFVRLVSDEGVRFERIVVL